MHRPSRPTPTARVAPAARSPLARRAPFLAATRGRPVHAPSPLIARAIATARCRPTAREVPRRGGDALRRRRCAGPGRRRQLGRRSGQPPGRARAASQSAAFRLHARRARLELRVLEELVGAASRCSSAAARDRRTPRAYAGRGERRRPSARRGEGGAARRPRPRARRGLAGRSASRRARHRAPHAGWRRRELHGADRRRPVKADVRKDASERLRACAALLRVPLLAPRRRARLATSISSAAMPSRARGGRPWACPRRATPPPPARRPARSGAADPAALRRRRSRGGALETRPPPSSPARLHAPRGAALARRGIGGMRGCIDFRAADGALVAARDVSRTRGDEGHADARRPLAAGRDADLLERARARRTKGRGGGLPTRGPPVLRDAEWCPGIEGSGADPRDGE